MLRKQQKEFESVMDEIVSGEPVNIIDVVATPGSGKSSLPIQACKLIKHGLADAILWIVPRSSLQDQGERGFIDPFFRKMLQHDFMIRSSTNEVNPCRGTNGFVTTYQAIGVDKENTVLTEILSKRYIVVIDEFHHLENEGIWHESLKKIIEFAFFVVKMTGTLGRGDKKPIAYINYRKNKPSFNDSQNSRLIKYSRTDALKEKAILPIEFHLHDGSFKWKTASGKNKSVSSFSNAVSGKQVSESLYTALHSEFSNEMIVDCVNHWKNYKRFNPRSKLLIVTADAESAEKAKKNLDKIGVKSEIATSHDKIGVHDIKAQKSIKNFKGQYLDCLVTIAMCYEGLDVPAATHMCLLTNIRSKEWIEQAVARVVRIDKLAGSYETQMAYVFAPADKRFRKVVEMIKKEQLTAIEEPIKDGLIIQCTKCKFQDFKGICTHNPKPGNIDKIFYEGSICEYFEQKPIQEQKKITPISSEITARERFQMGFYGHKSEYVPESMPEIVQKTIKEQETELRQEINKHVRVFCWENRYDNQQINHELKERFGKARNLMMLSELQNLYKYLKLNFRLDAPIRTKRKRVSSRIVKTDTINQSMYNPIDQLLPGM